MATDEEWKELEIFLGMSAEDADATGWRGTDDISNALKEAGTEHWDAPNLGNNSSGFTALPGGERNGSTGNDDFLGLRANFWATRKYSTGEIARAVRFIHNNQVGINRGTSYSKQYGYNQFVLLISLI